jgi:5-aminopentanamidase
MTGNFERGQVLRPRANCGRWRFRALSIIRLSRRLRPCCPPPEGAGTLYNAAAVFHCGKVLAIYRKRHPAIRRSVYSAGDQSPIFTVGHLSFGIMICNDSNYPKIAADMVARGAKALFVPSNNSLPPGRADVVALTRSVDIARAMDNEVMIVRADVAGCTADRVSFGSSAIVEAKGTVLRAGGALREDILVTEVHTGFDQPR